MPATSVFEMEEANPMLPETQPPPPTFAEDCRNICTCMAMVLGPMVVACLGIGVLFLTLFTMDNVMSNL
jgi:hypothetical protein